VPLSAWISLAVFTLAVVAILVRIVVTSENKTWYDSHEGAEVQAAPRKTIGAEIGGRPLSLSAIETEDEPPPPIDPVGSGRT
jgi:hypothetical protein